MRDVPFVAGKVIWSHASRFLVSRPAVNVLLSLSLCLSLTRQSVSSSHSVRANVQSVLSLLKQYRPNMYEQSEYEPDASTSPVIGEDLSELLQGLTDELRLMTL